MMASAEARHREFERLVNAIPDAVVVTDRTGVIHFVNEAAFELFGKHEAGFLGQPIGFAVKVGAVSEIELRRGNESRACEMRVVACEWNGVPAALALIRDMTEQKRLSGQLQHTQKMEAIGMMAGGIAHDFNNLLLVMLVHAELLRDDRDLADPRLAGVFEIIQSIERAQALTRQLLAFSRKQPTETSVVNLGEVVAGVHAMLRRMLSANIEIVTLACDDIWPVRVDRRQIEQVLMNLAVNARDAMPSGGRFAIEIENRAVGGADCDGAPGDYVAVRVSDSGIGIEAEHLSRIFDPFFTTRDRGRGTGLGLSMCYGVVAQAGGHLTVDSKVGAGTSFTILLPRTSETAGQSAADRLEPDGPSGRETILIVEDDQAVMRATAATLRKGGYTVLTASNGDEARRLVQPKAAGIDLVLSDVVMPQLSGPEFAEYLAGIRPDIPLIFMTGYSEYPVSTESGDNRIANHRAIMKPFRPRDLLCMVREVLDAHAQAAA
jgi:signal transduction histidine kinase